MDVHPMIAEAMRKAAVVWIEVAGRPAVGAWAVWHDGAAYVVSGAGEQPLPGLADAAVCSVTARSGDNGARIVTWAAGAARVEPGTELWAEVAPLLLAKRLNLPDAAGAEQRWAETATITKLTPVGDPDDLPEGSLAAPPVASPARTPTRVPRTLHRTKRAAR